MAVTGKAKRGRENHEGIEQARGWVEESAPWVVDGDRASLVAALEVAWLAGYDHTPKQLTDRVVITSHDFVATPDTHNEFAAPGEDWVFQGMSIEPHNRATCEYTARIAWRRRS